jgi:hypothetical protein
LGQKRTQKGDDMRLASFVIYVFFMSAVGLAAHSEVPADILYDDLNSRHGWDGQELEPLDCRNTQQAGINSQSGTAGDYLFDDCLFTLQPASLLPVLESGDKNWFNYSDNQWNRLAYTGRDTKDSRSEVSRVSDAGDLELADNPSPRIGEYDKVISWIKDAYRAWLPKDHSGSMRLLLLSFGLVGIIGMRRKFKKP